jgi:hypothetical protein
MVIGMDKQEWKLKQKNLVVYKYKQGFNQILRTINGYVVPANQCSH